MTTNERPSEPGHANPGDISALERNVIQRLLAAGVQFTVRESFADVPIGQAEAELALVDPVLCRAAASCVAVSDYRLYMQAGGLLRCRAITKKGTRCAHVMEYWHHVDGWVSEMQRGGFCDVHASRRVRRNRRRPLDASCLEPEAAPTRPDQRPS